MAKSEAKYIQFPLTLLKDLFEDKEKALNTILEFGMYNYSICKKVAFREEDAIQNLILRNYNNDLPYELQKHFKDCETFGADEDYRGFGYAVTEERREVWEICEEKPIIMTAVMNYYRACLTLNNLNISSSDKQLKNAKVVYECYHQKGQTMTSINLDTLWNYRDNNKSKDEIEQLAVNCALRSMIGKKPYKLIHYSSLFVRMFGYESPNKVPKKLPKSIEVLFNKYNTGNCRYYRRLMRDAMEEKWHYSIYSDGNRGIYFSTSYSLEQLAEVSIKQSKGYKTNQKKLEKQLAKQKALDKIKQEQKVAIEGEWLGF